MEELYKEGKIKAIGVSNFLPDRLMDLIVHNDILPAINQVETHPFHQQIDNATFMKEQGVQIQSWGPFAEGRNQMFSNELLTSIAEKHSKSVAQVILRWLVQRDVVVIPKSVRRERLAENFDIFSFELSREEMEQIATLDTGESLFLSYLDPEIAKMLGNLRVEL